MIKSKNIKVERQRYSKAVSHIEKKILPQYDKGKLLILQCRIQTTKKSRKRETTSQKKRKINKQQIQILYSKLLQCQTSKR
jgi:hypothetical protein